MSAPDFKAMGDPLNDRLPPRRRPPRLEYCGVCREHPCLCDPPRQWFVAIPRPAPYMTMNDRDHWRAKAAKVKTWRQAARRAATGLTFPPCVLGFVLEVPDRRRRDPHNYYPTIKALIDGLVDVGFWPDDTPEWVTTTEPTFAVVSRTTHQCVHITLTERAL